jgi:hypothetical protein
VDAKSQSRQIERAALERELARARELVGRLRIAAGGVYIGATGSTASGNSTGQLRDVEHAVRLLEVRLADLKPD